MNDVEQWDPSANSLTDIHRSILIEAARQLDRCGLRLEPDEQGKLRSVLRRGFSSWECFAEAEDSPTIVGWIKVLTLCEDKYSGFECGAKSPVIPLVRVLRKRGMYSKELTTWIKEHTSNRFLPHGSLLDRL